MEKIKLFIVLCMLALVFNRGFNIIEIDASVTVPLNLILSGSYLITEGYSYYNKNRKKFAYFLIASGLFMVLGTIIKLIVDYLEINSLIFFN